MFGSGNSDQNRRYLRSSKPRHMMIDTLEERQLLTINPLDTVDIQ